jgi:predicted dehydrogenase
MQKKIRWGILGCGRIAHKFAEDLHLSKTSITHACASRDAGKAKDFALKYQVDNWFSDYESLANCDEIDAIYIATPHSHHYEHTMLCLKAKKAVLCEKPLSVNQKNAIELFRISREYNVLLMEAMWTAFLPAIKSVKNDVMTGSIGEVRHINADFGFISDFEPESRLYNKNLAGGSLLDIGIYPLFISLFLMGMPDKLSALGHLVHTGVDDECAITLQYPNGATATLYSSISHSTDTKCEIFGRDGKILIPGRFHEQTHYYLENREGTKKIECGKTGFGYYHEIEHFNKCLMANSKESDVMTSFMSQDLARLMDMTRKEIGLKYPWD